MKPEKRNAIDRRMRGLPQVIKSWAICCQFILLGAGSVGPLAAAGADQPGRAEPATAPCTADKPDSRIEALCYAIGDQLKITFFERIDDAAEESRAGAAAAPVSPELVERLELTGSYIIQADGRVYLPLLGAISIAGQPHAAAQDKLATAFSIATHHTAIVSIVLTEREPVYVVGSVTKPGTVKYLPGMTTLHAIALSDGLEGARPEYSRALDAMRERERRDRSIEHLKRQLARRVALLAERDGRFQASTDERLVGLAATADAEALVAEAPSDRHFAATTERLVGLAGKADAKALIADASSERHLAATARVLQETILDETISATRKDLERMRTRITHLGSSVKSRQERLDTLSSVENRATLNPFSLHQARTELVDLEERQEEVKGSLAQLEQKLTHALNERTKLALEARVELARELKVVETDIAEDELTIEATTRLIKAAGGTLEVLAREPLSAGVEIVRRTPEGMQRFRASEDTRLQPGDLLEITPLLMTGAIR
jgi:polysaccharide export outer membrane protein/exopolysaccharide production protein ExoF